MKFNWKKIIVSGTIAGMVIVTGCASNVPSNNQGNRNGERLTNAVTRNVDGGRMTRGLNNRTGGAVTDGIQTNQGRNDGAGRNNGATRNEGATRNNSATRNEGATRNDGTARSSTTRHNSTRPNAGTRAPHSAGTRADGVARPQAARTGHNYAGRNNRTTADFRDGVGMTGRSTTHSRTATPAIEGQMGVNNALYIEENTNLVGSPATRARGMTRSTQANRSTTAQPHAIAQPATRGTTAAQLNTTNVTNATKTRSTTTRSTTTRSTTPQTTAQTAQPARSTAAPAAPRATAGHVAAGQVARHRSTGLNGVTIVGRSRQAATPRTVQRTARNVTRNTTSSINRTARPVRATRPVDRTNNSASRTERRQGAPRASRANRVRYENRRENGRSSYTVRELRNNARPRENIRTALGSHRSPSNNNGVYK